jgi:hypothetical protein
VGALAPTVLCLSASGAVSVAQPRAHSWHEQQQLARLQLHVLAQLGSRSGGDAAACVLQQQQARDWAAEAGAPLLELLDARAADPRRDNARHTQQQRARSAEQRAVLAATHAHSTLLRHAHPPPRGADHAEHEYEDEEGQAPPTLSDAHARWRADGPDADVRVGGLHEQCIDRTLLHSMLCSAIDSDVLLAHDVACLSGSASGVARGADGPHAPTVAAIRTASALLHRLLWQQSV